MLSWARENVEILKIKSEKLEVEKFTEIYLSQNLPIIVQGAFDELDCRKWNFEYLQVF